MTYLFLLLTPNFRCFITIVLQWMVDTRKLLVWYSESFLASMEGAGNYTFERDLTYPFLLMGIDQGQAGSWDSPRHSWGSWKTPLRGCHGPMRIRRAHWRWSWECSPGRWRFGFRTAEPEGKRSAPNPIVRCCGNAARTLSLRIITSTISFKWVLSLLDNSSELPS
jgi:hypothetical protein